jgi:hypothetical protein
MMLPLATVELISFSASWLTFLGFVLGLYECWRFRPLRVFFGMMFLGYLLTYAVDIAHGKNPLVLISPAGRPAKVYFWAPVCRQMVARTVICASVWMLLYTYKTYLPPTMEDEECPTLHG